MGSNDFRVKQMQRAASVERKTILKEQRNLIKKQLSTDNIVLKMKVSTPRRRASFGPLKVIQTHTESIMSETSISKKSSTDKEEIYSITSQHTVSEISEVEIARHTNMSEDVKFEKQQQHIKRTLLMREAALRKRRKQAEELLQWNQKLLEEEKRINELELKANFIIRQQHNTDTVSDEKHKFSGKQLNKLWYNLTGCDRNNFKEEKIYRMSQIALERFCKSAREYSVNTKLLSKNNNSDYSVANSSDCDNVSQPKIVQSLKVPSDSEKHTDQLIHSTVNDVSEEDYTLDFEVNSTDHIVADINVNENIDELIQNFSRIEDDISSMGTKHYRDGVVNEVSKNESPNSNKSVSDEEISIIETNRLEEKTPLPTSEIFESLEKSQNNDLETITEKNEFNQTISGEESIKDVIITTESANNSPSKTENCCVKISNNFNIEETEHETFGLRKEPVAENANSKETDLEEELSSDFESVKESKDSLANGQIQNKENTSLLSIRPLEINKTEYLPSFTKNTHSENQIYADDSINTSTFKKNIVSHNEETEHFALINPSVSLEHNYGTQQEASNSRTCKQMIDNKNLNNSSSVVKKTESIYERSENSRKNDSLNYNELQIECDTPNKSENEMPSISSTSYSSLIKSSCSTKQDTSVSANIHEFSTSNNGNINIKKRVTEIMTEANQSQKCGDKRPRLQDFYMTTYDVESPTSSPELESPVDDQLKISAISSIFDNEAEEILKKQLAIEQEIKQITEQQQKQQLPYIYVREIPNKPPPPYTPPSIATLSSSTVVVIPTSEEIDEITKYSSKILHKAYLSSNLDNISISENTLNLITKDIPKEKYKFVFDLCKNICKDHYMQFDVEKCPTWLQVSMKPQLLIKKTFDVTELEKHISKKLREVFGYEKPQRRENSIIKWSRKKRDHVDEVLVVECQAEDEQWIYYEKDELLIMNEVTSEIMNLLVSDTADVMGEIFSKRLHSL